MQCQCTHSGRVPATRCTRVSRSLAVATAATALMSLVPQLALAEGGCPTGQRPAGTEKISGGNIDPTAGYGPIGADDAMFKATVGTYPADGNGSAFPNTGIGIMTGNYSSGFINQNAFPGDATPPGGGAAIPALPNWLAYNGKDMGAPTRLWQQTVTGLTAGKAYAFTAYFSNALAPGQQANYIAPRVSFRVDGAEVATRAVCDSGSDVVPATQACATEATADLWQRLGVSVTPAGSSVTLSLHDAQIAGVSGNDFAMSIVSFKECAPFGPEIDVASTSITFPTFTVGGAATSQTITVRNTGTDPLAIGSITKAGANAADFTVASDTCSGQTLAAATGTCTITVNFLAASAGAKTATLSIPSNDSDENPLGLTLSGTALAAGTVVDSDKDGVPDSDDLDDDNDGIPDTAEGDGDFDGDGIPNRLDLDSDNDGIPDIIEAGGVDANGDGRVDNFQDANRNGYHDPLESAPWPLPDTDKDGAKDFLDLNSDNDTRYDVVEAGLADANNDGKVDNFRDADGDGWDDNAKAAIGGKVLPDANGDGIPDYRQSTGVGEVLTRLEGGIGGGAAGLPALLALGGALALRRRRRWLAALGLLGASFGAQAAQGQFYVGGGVGQSMLEPEVVNIPTLSVSDKEDIGYKLFFGYDILNWLSVEAFGTKLGAAGFNNGGEIDYNAYGAGLVVNLPNNTPGLSLLAKLGLAEIDNSSDTIQFREVNGSEVYGGVGAEYQFKSGFAVRGEYEYFDEDAQLVSLSLLKRFGGSKPKPVPVVMAPEPKPAPPPPEPKPAPVPAPKYVTLDVESIYFHTDSAKLTNEATAKLDAAVQMLNAHPEVKMTLIGHADDRASDDYNMGLSMRRAKSAMLYIQSKGIDASRLSYEGRGEREPRGDKTPAGRRENRRVDVVPNPAQVQEKR